MWRVLIVLGVAAIVALPAVMNQARAPYLPEIAKGTGKPHAEGNNFWRRNHMAMMTHDRDQTVYNGDRAIRASLGSCFDCHTVKDDEGTPVTYQDKRHFCRTCHDFAAVKVDCFMCHRSTPAAFKEPPADAIHSTARE